MKVKNSEEEILEQQEAQISNDYIEKINLDLLKSRTIIFNDYIETDIIYKVYYPLTKLIKDDPNKPIHLYLNTYGGNAHSALFISSFILTSKTPIYTYATGACFSGGGLILASGHKRFAYKYSMIMIHKSTVEDLEKAHSDGIQSQLEGMKKLDEHFYDLFTLKTNLNKEDLTKKLNVDWYLDPKEALKYKIIDKIL